MAVVTIARIPTEATSVVVENIIFWKVTERAVKVCIAC